MIYSLRIAKAGPGAGLYSPVHRLRPLASPPATCLLLLLARFASCPILNKEKGHRLVMAFTNK